MLAFTPGLRSCHAPTLRSQYTCCGIRANAREGLLLARRRPDLTQRRIANCSSPVFGGHPGPCRRQCFYGQRRDPPIRTHGRCHKGGVEKGEQPKRACARAEGRNRHPPTLSHWWHQTDMLRMTLAVDWCPNLEQAQIPRQEQKIGILLRFHGFGRGDQLDTKTRIF